MFVYKNVALKSICIFPLKGMWNAIYKDAMASEMKEV